METELNAASLGEMVPRPQALANSVITVPAGVTVFTGAADILEGKQGMAAGMSSDADPARLSAGLGSRWATAETSFKYHASCRHTHPSADALLLLMREHRLRPDDIAAVTAQVHQGAIDVLAPIVEPASVHQSKFSMGIVLALAATLGRAGLADFTDAALKGNEKEQAARGHGYVTPSKGSPKDAQGRPLQEDVWKYLFTSDVEKVGAAVPAEPGVKMDQRTDAKPKAAKKK